MKNVKLSNGLNLNIDEKMMDNMELLDDLVDLDNGNGYAISRVLNRMMDAGEKKKLYDHLRVDGVTSITAVADAMKEIFEKLGEQGKN